MSEAIRERLVEVNSRLGRVTAFPWVNVQGCVVAPAVRVKIGNRFDAETFMSYGGSLVCESMRSADAELVAHAPADLAFLADCVTALMRDRDRLTFLLDQHYVTLPFDKPRGRYWSREAIDHVMTVEGYPLFTPHRAELPRL